MYEFSVMKSIMYKPMIKRKLKKVHNGKIYESIKEKRSYKEKMKRKRRVCDLLRFSIVVPEKEYGKVCKEYTKVFKTEEIKNYWYDEYPYYGYHIQVYKSVVPYEIQIHTKESIKLRENEIHHWMYKYGIQNRDDGKKYYMSLMIRKVIAMTILIQVYKIRQQFEQDNQP